MTGWRWVGASVAYAVHDQQLAAHRGLAGMRDQGAVESALARPRDLVGFGDPDAADLAAAYAYGLARNHGFSDGKNRTAWLIARLLLADNGVRLRFDARDAVLTMEAVAAGVLDETTLAAWFGNRIIKLE